MIINLNLSHTNITSFPQKISFPVDNALQPGSAIIRTFPTLNVLTSSEVSHTVYTIDVSIFDLGKH